MNELLHYLNWFMLAGTVGFMGIFFIASIREKEGRAALLAFIFAGLSIGLWTWFLYGAGKAAPWLNTVFIAAFALPAAIAVIPFMPRRPPRNLENAIPYDERDYMFSRNMLKFNPDLAQQYYTQHPEKNESDRLIHDKPEIGEPGALFYDPSYSPFFDAAFAYLSKTRPASEGEKTPEPAAADKKKLRRVIREMSRIYGAADVGFVRLQPHHIYSHSGRRPENWGREIRLEHRCAVVLIVPMRVDMMKEAPGLPAILESSRAYVEAAKIAQIVAEYIRGFGYEARAHTDGNYLTLCVPLAVDSGLGALSRMGVFLHPVHGPCVRISAVTTDLDLEPDRFPHAISNAIEHFCAICKKCADNCPTQSIEKGDEPESRGFRHWSINQESCFSYWKTIGTDCGFCIRVCPYTKPDTLIHRLVRWYISQNRFNQRIALWMDDLFYGRKLRVPDQKPDQITLPGTRQ